MGFQPSSVGIESSSYIGDLPAKFAAKAEKTAVIKVKATGTRLLDSNPPKDRKRTHILPT